MQTTDRGPSQLAPPRWFVMCCLHMQGGRFFCVLSDRPPPFGDAGLSFLQHWVGKTHKGISKRSWCLYSLEETDNATFTEAAVPSARMPQSCRKWIVLLPRASAPAGQRLQQVPARSRNTSLLHFTRVETGASAPAGTRTTVRRVPQGRPIHASHSCRSY